MKCNPYNNHNYPYYRQFNLILYLFWKFVTKRKTNIECEGFFPCLPGIRIHHQLYLFAFLVGFRCGACTFPC